MSWLWKPVLIVAGLVAVALSGCSQASDSTERVVIRFSKFERDAITVRAGEPITFVLQNDDPIAHEWIVGTEDVHERHRTGSEPYHDLIPSEVTVPALSSLKTMLTFNDPGEYPFICTFACHWMLMRGVLRVE